VIRNSHLRSLWCRRRRRKKKKRRRKLKRNRKLSWR